MVLMPQQPLSGGSLWHWLLPEGSRLPSLMPLSPSHFTVSFSGSFYKWGIADEMFWAATVVAPFLICLGVSQPYQTNHELLCYPFDSTGDCHSLDPHLADISSSKCAKCTASFPGGLVTLEFPQGEETSSPWVGGPSAVWVLRPQGNSIESSFSASWVALR